MTLICPDVLAEARGLSPGAAGFLLFVGFLLWAFGWRWHRFWVVFAITLTAGLLGISAGRSAGSQVLVVGLLLAVSAGMLALELARILAFVTGGVVMWVAAEAVFPQAQELWAMFLCGGLLGVALYRVWTMLATSLIGILLCWHSLLVLAETLFNLDGPKLAAENNVALNSGVIGAALLGVVVQAYTGREDAPAEVAEAKEEKKPEKKPEKKSFFSRLVPSWS